ncbi:MAG: menaquinone biosynthesis protein [Firmicutes bacterium]|nr:menaquinone biosynthesis protein [Bacillota bacterium]
MARLRISVVEYLNTAPLVWGFTDGPWKGKYELSFTLPSECAEQLRNGAADVAIIPAIEYQTIPDIVLLPGMAVAARGPVRSILLVSRRPIERAQRVALDTSSRSSRALVRLLFRNRWKASPEFVDAPPDPAAMLQSCDAALIIGDPALRISVKMDALGETQPSGEECCGSSEPWPVPGLSSFFLYDVAQEWIEMTGKPCVLAVWAARRAAVTPELVADFLASRAYGLARLRDIAEGASLKLDLPAPALETYLRENIDYALDAEHCAGLELYFRMCAEAGLIPAVRPMEFVPQPARVTA